MVAKHDVRSMPTVPPAGDRRQASGQESHTLARFACECEHHAPGHTGVALHFAGAAEGHDMSYKTFSPPQWVN